MWPPVLPLSSVRRMSARYTCIVVVLCVAAVCRSLRNGIRVSLQIAQQHGIPFLETSAKTNVNVDKAFLNLAQSILDKVSPLGLTGSFVQLSEVFCCSLTEIYLYPFAFNPI